MARDSVWSKSWFVCAVLSMDIYLALSSLLSGKSVAKAHSSVPGLSDSVIVGALAESYPGPGGRGVPMDLGPVCPLVHSSSPFWRI